MLVVLDVVLVAIFKLLYTTVAVSLISRGLYVNIVSIKNLPDRESAAIEH